MRCTVARARRFDAAGKTPTTITKDGKARTLYYDEQGRVARVKLGTANSAAPSVYNYYNEHGQRIFRTEPLTDAAFKAASPTGALNNQLAGVNFYYNLQNKLVFQKGTGTSNRHSQDAYYFWLGDIPVGVMDFASGKMYNIYADHLNTPRQLFNWDDKWGQPTTRAKWQWSYSPFGGNQPTTARNNFKEEHWDALNLGTVTRNTSAPDPVINLRYPGQFYDHSTGLHQNWMRMYDPQTARYTRADPIGLNGGMNRYAYVGGNALWAVDERGEASVVTVVVVAGVAYVVYSACKSIDDYFTALDDMSKNTRAKRWHEQQMYNNLDNSNVARYHQGMVNHHVNEGVGNAKKAAVSAMGIPGTTTGGMVPTTRIDLTGAVVSNVIISNSTDCNSCE